MKIKTLAVAMILTTLPNFAWASKCLQLFSDNFLIEGPTLEAIRDIRDSSAARLTYMNATETSESFTVYSHSWKKYRSHIAPTRKYINFALGEIRASVVYKNIFAGNEYANSGAGGWRPLHLEFTAMDDAKPGQTLILKYVGEEGEGRKGPQQSAFAGEIRYPDGKVGIVRARVNKIMVFGEMKYGETPELYIEILP